MTDLVLPDYAGACLSNLTPALQARPRTAAWLPEPTRDPRGGPVVLLVLDGLGWLQLEEHRQLAPNLTDMAGGAITSVAPTTTATALASIVTGSPPAVHGLVGYRVRVAGDRVLNVLRWRLADGTDAVEEFDPGRFQPRPAFGGRVVPTVVRAEFLGTGFTAAIMAGSDHVGYRAPSSIAVEVARLLADPEVDGSTLVYAYYDCVDSVAHAHGLGAHYRAELAAADRLVGEILAAMPAGATLVVTADHGQVEVGAGVLAVAPDVLGDDVVFQSGEARFRWLHVRNGDAASTVSVAERARERYEADGRAWVRTREEVVAEGWFGGPLSSPFAARLGDVALVARAPIAFVDPTDRGTMTLVCRHGGMTAAEVLVPLLAKRV